METLTKPYRARASELEPAWHVIDAEGKILGRLSSEIAVILQGKHKPTYVSYMNTGDYVIVVNAGKVRVTGDKLSQKVYYRHSGYHGGLKEQRLEQLVQKAPTQAIKAAVKGMLPKNRLGRRMLSRLKLYAGDSHPHEAQLNARPKVPKEEATSARPAELAAKPAPSAVGDTVEVEAPVTGRKRKDTGERATSRQAERSGTARVRGKAGASTGTKGSRATARVDEAGGGTPARPKRRTATGARGTSEGRGGPRTKRTAPEASKGPEEA